MPGIHGLKHVQCFSASHLSYHDPLRPHTQRGFDQIPDRHRPASRGVRIPRLHPYQIVDPLDLQLRRVFYRDHTLVMGNIMRYRIQECRLSGACPSRYENIIFRFDQKLQYMGDLRRNRTILQQLPDRHRCLGEFPDRDRGSV